LLGRVPLALLVVAVVITSTVGGGVVVYYDFGSHTSDMTTQTVTVTSLNTIVRLVTSVSSQDAAPVAVQLNGTVESEGNYPIAVEFCSLTRQILQHRNSTSLQNEISGISCGSYSAPIQVTNQTQERFGSFNQTYFFGTYSAKLPNNATYLLQVRLLQSSAGPGFEEEAGWLPLNYTSSSRILGYGIACFKILENSTLVFQCSSGFG
jgi:hypothetical protein